VAAENTRKGAAGSLIALGNWKRLMAPPSFIEFVQALLVREAVAVLCPHLHWVRAPRHKGCLIDFTASVIAEPLARKDGQAAE
jgi:hypothetical protein